ncbi:zinc ribbon domain-containing protein [Methanocella sp. CWC-04]|uniref:Zinc ribbon domain-containing protein n=1 Tax=Methanooceanicella nereidis TaxID=2052831 RepID=A0AAP2W700_9EURY|nr:zinc ribbon domain-containing protein [Methanocella sp. CWC-04]MCD1294611.1 zinc ribbon domain-containing protein [Methanocella sp. CWC-04]
MAIQESSRLQPFTRNFEDNSTEAGFQFTFYCDICQDGYKTRFIESKTYKKSGLFNMFGKAVAVGADLAGMYRVGGALERGTDILNERHEGMSPEWRREWEQAFEIAQNEAKGHFYRCPKCKKYVCESDWNEQDGLCVECAPRENVEVTAARAERMTEEIKEKARESNVFKGDIERRQTLCPECGKPAGEGKFCNNCGAALGLNKCPKCGAKNNPASRFCGECGTKL